MLVGPEELEGLEQNPETAASEARAREAGSSAQLLGWNDMPPPLPPFPEPHSTPEAMMPLAGEELEAARSGDLLGWNDMPPPVQEPDLVSNPTLDEAPLVSEENTSLEP